MKRLIALTILFIVFCVTAQAQVLKPIQWNSYPSSKEVKVGETITLHFKAIIEPTWYLYSSDFDPNLGPTVTQFQFEPNATYELVGKIKPIKPKKKYDEIWEGEYTYFTGTAEFQQKVNILSENALIKASVNYQVCTEADGKCIPLDEEFTFGPLKSSTKNATETTQLDSVSIDNEDTTTLLNDSSVNSETTSVETSTKEQEKEGVVLAQQGNADSGLFAFMIAAFLQGLLALLTPCVFPMIPMTVSYFTKQGGTKGVMNAIYYAASIVGIYTIVGVLVSALMGPEVANVLATHWIPNLIFFIIFIIFSVSFFGAFEIVLPSSWLTKIDSKADKGGFEGIIFMALALVLVSFSCTGPIVGSVLIQSSQGEYLRPVAGMFAFSMAFALPFGLFALFPSMLNKLPRSGGWMNTVKVFLGFLELGLSLKFLSIIDQVYHLGILDREINIAIWIVLAVCLGMYLLGKIMLPHDSPLDKISVPRFLMAMASFAFAIYLLPGMFGAPLKMFAGYLPPESSHDFDLKRIIADEVRSVSGSSMQATSASESVKYGDLFHLPHGLKGYFDLKEGLAAAKTQNKPVFIDFTGHGCVNCREMEAVVWKDPEVLKKLREDFIIIALYVDDPTEVPESEWIVSNVDGKTKKSIGKINANYQIETFNNNAQPYYILLDGDQRLLAQPHSYNKDVKTFIEFLEKGKAKFAELNK